MSFWSFLTTALNPIAKIIDEVFTNDEERINAQAKLTQVQNTIGSKILEYESQLVEAKSKIIIAEAQGQSWIQRSWRPVLMLVIVAIVANNYIIYPYLSMFTDKAIVLDLPSELFTLMTVGVGGYIAGRTGEKMVEKWKS